MIKIKVFRVRFRPLPSSGTVSLLIKKKKKKRDGGEQRSLCLQLAEGSDSAVEVSWQQSLKVKGPGASFCNV